MKNQNERKTMIKNKEVYKVKSKILSVLCALVLVLSFNLVIAVPAAAVGPLPVDLGAAGNFAVLAATTVTNTGASVVNGDAGVSPGTALTGFLEAPGPVTLTGTIYTGADSLAGQAQSDAALAYGVLVAQTPDVTYAPIMEIGGLTFTPGVYLFPSSAQITTAAGPVTLDFQGNPDAVFIFQMGSTLITDVSSQVIAINNNDQPVANVFWAVGSSATIGVDSQFVGNILAIASITLNHGASVAGSALALNAAVTMDTNSVSVGSGGTVPPPTPTPTPVALGTAGNFAVLGDAVTLTDSVVTGDVGSTDANVTNTTSTVTGTVYAGGALAVLDAYADFLAAYGALAGEPFGETLTGLEGVTLEPGVYSFDAAATLTGVLTLDAQGDANAVWIFKIGTSGTGALTGTNFSVVMDNGGVPGNVFWWVAQGATMTTSNFKGTILAGAAITFTGGTFNGRALATNGVTLTDNTITVPAP